MFGTSDIIDTNWGMLHCIIIYSQMQLFHESSLKRIVQLRNGYSSNFRLRNCKAFDNLIDRAGRTGHV
jgi:hypothetical protein